MRNQIVAKCLANLFFISATGVATKILCTLSFGSEALLNTFR